MDRMSHLWDPGSPWANFTSTMGRRLPLPRLEASSLILYNYYILPNHANHPIPHELYKK